MDQYVIYLQNNGIWRLIVRRLDWVWEKFFTNRIPNTLKTQ